MQSMLHYRYTQIKRYFHIAVLVPTGQNQVLYKMLLPLYKHLNTQFKVFYVPSQNVSVDEIMKALTNWSMYTLKMLNKPVKEGYKM
jgi:hypothetical protein